jgi:hypothetical protein
MRSSISGNLTEADTAAPPPDDALVEVLAEALG